MPPVPAIAPARVEALGPAERMINTLVTYADHAYHGRPGIVSADPASPTGVKWEPVTHKDEGDPVEKVVYKLVKVGKKTDRVRAGVMRADGKVLEGGRIVGEYRKPGLFPEVVAWLYGQVAAVYKMDNDFAARWASYAYTQEHRDLKAVLAAFMLVQGRKGDAVRDNGAVAFYDDDFRDVGEAMLLTRRTDDKDLNPKMVLRVWDILHLPVVVAANRELGFGVSTKNPPLGRLAKAVEKWLRQRDRNPKMLESAVKAGYRTTIMALATRVGYKPENPAFFRILRWKQKQSSDGRRSLAIGAAVSEAESWTGFTEAQVCERIVATKPAWKRVVGLLPASVGVTRAVLTAAVEAGTLSNADLIILTPTLEDLGLTTVEPVKSRWEKALAAADNQRAANIALRVKRTETVEKLAVATEVATTKAVAEVTKGLRIYFMVDVSGSMQNAIETAKTYVGKLLAGFPLDKIHISVFNTAGREIVPKAASQVGINHAFTGVEAGGGTDYGAGIRAVEHRKPSADEDVLFVFVGDEDASEFSRAVRASGLNPLAFGFLRVNWNGHASAVRVTAGALGIPCVMLDEAIFADPYAIPRALRNLIASTPVNVNRTVPVAAPRVTLVETILRTDLLQKPAWAA